MEHVNLIKTYSWRWEISPAKLGIIWIHLVVSATLRDSQNCPMWLVFLHGVSRSFEGPPILGNQETLTWSLPRNILDKSYLRLCMVMVCSPRGWTTSPSSPNASIPNSQFVLENVRTLMSSQRLNYFYISSVSTTHQRLTQIRCEPPVHSALPFPYPEHMYHGWEVGPKQCTLWKQYFIVLLPYWIPDTIWLFNIAMENPL